MEIIKRYKDKNIVFLKKKDGIIYKAKIIETTTNKITIFVFNTNQTYTIPLHKPNKNHINTTHNERKQNTIRTPIGGRVVKIHVHAGDNALKDRPLVTIESMKMENEIRAPFNLFVKSVHISPGDLVEQDHLLLQITVGEEEK